MAEQEMGIRLAFRAEGNYVYAYHAHRGTMDEAIPLGMVHRRLLELDPKFFQQWKALISDMYATLIAEKIGAMPKLVEEKAPEHEKAGRA